MTKLERRNLIRDRWHQLVGFPLRQFIPVSRVEIREAAEIYSKRKIDDSILDEEMEGIDQLAPMLAEQIEILMDDDALLTKSEKHKLAREVREMRVTRFKNTMASQPLLLMA